jgi:hypothetical protein
MKGAQRQNSRVRSNRAMKPVEVCLLDFVAEPGLSEETEDGETSGCKPGSPVLWLTVARAVAGQHLDEALARCDQLVLRSREHVAADLPRRPTWPGVGGPVLLVGWRRSAPSLAFDLTLLVPQGARGNQKTSMAMAVTRARGSIQ